MAPDRKSTRLNSSHVKISYAVFCLILRLPQSTPFPYTTLFRSSSAKAPPARWDYLRTSSEAISAAHCAVSPLSAQYAPLRVACCASHRPPAPGEPAQRDHQDGARSEEHTSELQSRENLVCRLLLDPPTSPIYTLSLHDALPIFICQSSAGPLGLFTYVVGGNKRSALRGVAVIGAIRSAARRLLRLTSSTSPRRAGPARSPGWRQIGRAHV